MPHGITQCYLPPGRGDIPALTPAEAGTRTVFSFLLQPATWYSDPCCGAPAAADRRLCSTRSIYPGRRVHRSEPAPAARGGQLMWQTDGRTDGRTPSRYINPAPHTTWAVPISIPQTTMGKPSAVWYFSFCSESVQLLFAEPCFRWSPRCSICSIQSFSLSNFSSSWLSDYFSCQRRPITSCLVILSYLCVIIAQLLVVTLHTNNVRSQVEVFCLRLRTLYYTVCQKWSHKLMAIIRWNLKRCSHF